MDTHPVSSEYSIAARVFDATISLAWLVIAAVGIIALGPFGYVAIAIAEPPAYKLTAIKTTASEKIARTIAIVGIAIFVLLVCACLAQAWQLAALALWAYFACGVTLGIVLILRMREITWSFGTTFR